MKRLIVLIGVLIHTLAYAQLSEFSVNLEELRVNVLNNPTRQNEISYLEAFPSSFPEFQFTFYGKECCQELYDKHREHLTLLHELSKKYPETVLEIWLGVSIDGHGDADAIGMLQRQLVTFVSIETRAFAEAIKKKTEKQRLSIIRFLADVENHSSYIEYRMASQELKRMGFVKLHTEFEEAKKRRMKAKDH